VWLGGVLGGRLAPEELYLFGEVDVALALARDALPGRQRTAIRFAGESTPDP
jgi:hypothetical protein